MHWSATGLFYDRWKCPFYYTMPSKWVMILFMRLILAIRMLASITKRNQEIVKWGHFIRQAIELKIGADFKSRESYLAKFPVY